MYIYIYNMHDVYIYIYKCIYDIQYNMLKTTDIYIICIMYIHVCIHAYKTSIYDHTFKLSSIKLTTLLIVKFQ